MQEKIKNWIKETLGIKTDFALAHPKDIKNGETVSVDTIKGVIRNITRKKIYKFEKYPPFMQKIIKAGGLMQQIKKK